MEKWHRTERCGVPGPSCGLCTFGLSMGARAFKTQSLEPRLWDASMPLNGPYRSLVLNPWHRPDFLWHIADIVLPTRAVGQGTLSLHAQGSSYSSLTRSYSGPVGGQEQHIVCFLKGSRRLNPPRPFTIPTWDLPTVPGALKGPLFEPLQSVDLWSLLLKITLLLALASVKRMGDLLALSVSPTCLQFGPNDSKIVLKPRHGYVPKVLSTPFRAQVISLSAIPPSDEDQELKLLCLIRALKIYLERSSLFMQSDQLFVCFGNCTKGHPVTKHRLSRWIVDAIMLAYSCLVGVV